MSHPNPRIESRRLMLRALHALVRAQLKQRDFLSIDEIVELQIVEEKLAERVKPAVPLACCGSWKEDQHFPNCPTQLRNVAGWCLPCQHGTHEACHLGSCTCECVSEVRLAE